MCAKVPAAARAQFARVVVCALEAPGLHAAVAPRHARCTPPVEMLRQSHPGTCGPPEHTAMLPGERGPLAEWARTRRDEDPLPLPRPLPLSHTHAGALGPRPRRDLSKRGATCACVRPGVDPWCHACRPGAAAAAGRRARRATGRCPPPNALGATAHAGLHQRCATTGSGLTIAAGTVTQATARAPFARLVCALEVPRLRAVVAPRHARCTPPGPRRRCPGNEEAAQHQHQHQHWWTRVPHVAEAYAGAQPRRTRCRRHCYPRLSAPRTRHLPPDDTRLAANRSVIWEGRSPRSHDYCAVVCLTGLALANMIRG